MNLYFRKIINFFPSIFGYRIIRYSNLENKIIDPQFLEIYNQCKEYTYITSQGAYALYQTIKYIVKAKIEGDFVECGVWKGGAAMIIAKTLISLGETKRKIYLYDTYEGMVEPTAEDKIIGTNKLAIVTWKKKQKKGKSDWCFCNLEEVKNNLLTTGYALENLIFVKGKVEQTIPNTIPSKISLLRLDTDWYESTKHELVHLFPCLEKNGVLIVDDYGCWAGSRKAVDEYFMNIPIFLNSVDYQQVLGIKI
jgi:O-methyltransferase